MPRLMAQSADVSGMHVWSTIEVGGIPKERYIHINSSLHTFFRFFYIRVKCDIYLVLLVMVWLPKTVF